MADRIREAFEAAKARGRIALAPYVTVGYPRLDSTVAVVKALSAAGADVIELGIPFSDPLADGPTIQASSFAALENGVTPEKCLATVSEIRSAGVRTPLVLMGYFNPVLSYGPERFCRDAAAAGADGMIVPDLSIEESDALAGPAAQAGLAIVPLLALTSTDARIARACRSARGFIYCVSVLGVTGARAHMSGRVRGLVEKVRANTDIPVAVGFGISKPEHVAQVARFADGVAVGGALIDAMGKGPAEDAPRRAAEFIRSLAAGAMRPGA